MHLKLNEKIICLDLSNSIKYKEKKNMIDLLIKGGSKVSFVLNKNVSLVIKDDKNDVDSYKCRTAFKLGIPVVHYDFIFAANGDVDSNVVDLKEFLITNKENEKNFKQGKIGKSNIYVSPVFHFYLKYFKIIQSYLARV